MTDNRKLFKKAKHTSMLWVWRIQQIGVISTLLITAMTLSITVSDKLLLNERMSFGIGPLFALILIGSFVAAMGWVWDRKFQMWVEQGEVVVERNPYMMYHMTAKEIVFNLTMWIPLWEKLGLIDRAKVMEDWTKKAMEVDLKIKPRCDELIKSFGQEKFIQERYPWYGV